MLLALDFRPLATSRDRHRLPDISAAPTTSTSPPVHGTAPDVPRRRDPMRRPTARITICATALLTFILEAITPDTRAGDFERAKALYLDRHYAEAQVIFEKIVETEPVNAAAAYYLGALALRRGNVAEAVRQLETATRLAPDSGLYHRELGDAYGAAAGQAGMFSKLTLAGKAQAAYQRAIKLEPGDIEHRLRLMNYYVQAPLLAGGGIEKAYDVAEAIRVRDPLQGGLAVTTLHLAEKRWPQAFAEIDALQPLHSGNPDFSYLLARVSAASGQQLDRGEASLLYYLSLGSPKGPATPAQANQLLGTIREKAGNLTGAIAAYRAALALDANLTGVRQALDRLQDAKP